MVTFPNFGLEGHGVESPQEDFVCLFVVVVVVVAVAVGVVLIVVAVVGSWWLYAVVVAHCPLWIPLAFSRIQQNRIRMTQGQSNQNE